MLVLTPFLPLPPFSALWDRKILFVPTTYVLYITFNPILPSLPRVLSADIKKNHDPSLLQRVSSPLDSKQDKYLHTVRVPVD